MYRVARAAAATSVAGGVRASSSIRRAVLGVPAKRQVPSFLLVAATLSVLGGSRTMAAAIPGECANPSGEVPETIQATAKDILQMYTTKSTEEQAAIVHKHYRADAHFVDPLMDVATPREIHLAFYSLIKLFASVEAEQKSLTWNAKPELPSDLKASDVQQVVLNNRQVYHLSKTSIDLDVNTYLTIDPKTGLIVRHEDRWLNKGFKLPGFMKKPTGWFSSASFKMFGWGKQIDQAAGKTGAQ